MKVLLVDDEIHALHELEDTVTEVIPKAFLKSFTKAKDALEYAKENKPDIAFLDINMRFIDGLTIAKELIRLYPKCNIIFCTAYSEYALDAHDMFCSGYLLKPISTEKVQLVLKNLRYPLSQSDHRVELRCFGNFDVLCDGKPISFKYKKTRELLAYLTDRNGAEATTREIMASIFEEGKESYFSNIRLDLLNTLEALGASDVIASAYGRMRIVRDKVSCDYYDYLDGKNNAFHGEYMAQYSFAEVTCANLNKNK